MYDKVGILTYITESEGIGGLIKKTAEDFRVNEVANLELNDDGSYVIIRVTKKNWDTMNFARVLSNILGISQKRIYYAGTKDKKALTTQYFSIKDLSSDKIEKLKKVSLKDAEIHVVGKSRKPINLGDLIGNEFNVRVYTTSNNVCEKIESIKEELTIKGTPNFFGLQRFGSIRYITHEVGRLIVKREFKEAFWTYVAKPFEGESEEVRSIREELWNSRDARFGLRELPKHLRYERILLQRLREGKNEEEALLSLPKNLKMMFVHAYQSYIFNLLLSERIIEFGNLKEIENGDVISFVCFSNQKKYYHFKDDFSVVAKHTKRRIEFLIDVRRASLALPLPGYETNVDGWCKEKLEEILEKEGVKLQDFKNKYREFSSRGSFRSADILIEWTNFEYKTNDFVEFNFYLPKGCYATIFLREFMKT